MQIRKAKWVWLNQSAQADEYVAFYDTFSIEENEKCKLLISAAGDYNVFVNGVLVAFGQYPDFSHYKVYDEVDISGYLQKGKNERFNNIQNHIYYQYNYFPFHLVYYLV